MAAELPVVRFDRNCGFCRLWVGYWQQLTGDAVVYEAADGLSAVELVQPGGERVRGARAVFTLLALVPGKGGWQRAYDGIPGFAWAAELVYGAIAANRRAAYHGTVLLFGRRPAPPRYERVAWLFEKLLAVIYAVAFASFAVQARGLIGSNGILPLGRYLSAMRSTFGSAAVWMAPTVWWVRDTDAAVLAVPILGLAAAALVLAGVARRASLAAAFILYLSICTGGQDFYSFQWDLLLLEAGFLAIFLGSPVTVWLFRWLLFRLMFSSGMVKLLSGDATWRELTAMRYHYHTQPLPTALAWYADKLPAAMQKGSAATMFGIELLVPFLIFLPRRPRYVAAAGLVGLQVLILLTGNYAFFNLLTMALCVFLFSDADLGRLRLPARGLKALPRPVMAVMAAVVTVLSVSQLSATFFNRAPGPAAELLRYAQPFGIVNGYGLFAVMTTTRPEIVVQGSEDGQTWRDYEFRYKPGDLRGRPKWVAPFQPRLDWQMWFAALGSYQNNPWFINFMVRLLQGSGDVTGLLARGPGGKAPQFVRAELFEYSFSDAGTRGKTGQWWTREERGLYLPALSLRDIRQISRGSEDEEAGFHLIAVDAVPDHAGAAFGGGVVKADDLAGVQAAAGVAGAEAAGADIEQVAGDLDIKRIDNLQHDDSAGGDARLRTAVVVFLDGALRMHSFARPPGHRF